MISRFLWLALLLLVLTGCSGKPSASDIQTALQTRIRQELSDAQDKARAVGGEQSVRLLHSFGAPAPEDVRIENMKILKSSRLDNASYEVRIRFDTIAGERNNTATTTVIMQRAGTGWQLSLPQ